MNGMHAMGTSPENSTRQPVRNSAYIFGALFLLGLAISVMGFRFSQNFYQLEAQGELERVASQQSEILGQSISRYGDTVSTIKSLFNASENVTRDEFSAFVQSALLKFPAV